MFTVHFFPVSPEGIIVVQIYAGAYLWLELQFTQRGSFHQLVKALVQADMQINPDDHAETLWKPALYKAVFDALQSS
jgi:hypothetical protein